MVTRLLANLSFVIVSFVMTDELQASPLQRALTASGRGWVFDWLLADKLNQIGIDRKYLFPDLDGLFELVNWETRRTVDSREQRTAKKNEPGGSLGRSLIHKRSYLRQ